MTQIYCEKDGDLYTVIADGHADGGTVCAGISAIMQALDGWCSNFPLEHYRSTIQSGFCSVQFKGGVEADTAFGMALIGLLQIEKGYPGACIVTVEINE